MHDHAPLRAQAPRRPLRLRVGLHRRRTGGDGGRGGGLNRVTPRPDAIAGLPFVDVHAIRICAPPRAVWDALGPALRTPFGGRRAGRIAALLGCGERAASEPFLLQPGATLAGFRVVAADPPRELVLTGRHRFSDYALIFRIEEEESCTTFRAETRARFPGLRGRLYRAMVIGSRGHVVAVRHILRGVRRRSERERGSVIMEAR